MNENTPDIDRAEAVSVPRRNLLMGAAALGALSGLAVLGRANAEEHSHQHHQHTVDQGRMRIIEHATDCVMKGEICAAHCLELFKAGDTSVAECADTVHEMLASCTAMRQLAAYDSKHLKAFVRVCIGVCEDCEKACREHEKEHAECKACADSCADCIKVCRDYLA
jgi:Cys-rich four helix bundle protein (predicted Tat secretion target)